MKKYNLKIVLGVLIIIVFAALIFNNCYIKNMYSIDETDNMTYSIDEYEYIRMHRERYCYSILDASLLYSMNKKKATWKNISYNFTRDFMYKYKKPYNAIKSLEAVDFHDLGSNELYKYYLPNLYGNCFIIIGKSNNEKFFLDIEVEEVDNKINDFKILQQVKIVDGFGNIVNCVQNKFDEKFYLRNFEKILCPSYSDGPFHKTDEEKRGICKQNRTKYALSKNFLDKYGYDKDCIEHDVPISYLYCHEAPGGFSSRSFYCDCWYEVKNLKVTYLVTFSLSEDNDLSNFSINDVP